MSDRVQSPNRSEAEPQSRTPKQDRRAAAKAAAAKAAAARARRQRFTGALAGLAVVAVLIAVFVVFSKRDSNTGGENASAPGAVTTTGAATTDEAANPGSPSLPEGADPALGSKPEAKAGSGELTKLTVTPLIEGTGPAAQAGQQITVNYVGVYYQTGEEFDASWKGGQPFAFQLGAGNVIPGWDQGLVGVKVGSRVQLDIPAALAYGANPPPGYPIGPLRFIVDLLAVQ